MRAPEPSRPFPAPVRIPLALVHAVNLLGLRVRDYWVAFWREPLSFRLACAYIFFEYYRPQSIYPSLAIVPWSAICLMGGVAALGAEGGLSQRARSPVTTYLLLFAGVVLASMVVAWQPALSRAEWKHFWLWLPVYLLIIGTVTTFRRLMLFFALFALWNTKMSLSGVKQWASGGFQFRSWGVLGSPGPFNNSGEFSIEMVIFFSILTMILAAMWPKLSLFKRLVIGAVVVSAALSVVASSSRGAMGGLALASVWMVLFTRHKLRALSGAIILAGLLLVMMPPEFKRRFTTVGTDQSSITRAKYRVRGLEMMRDHPFLGIGYGNWLGFYRDRYKEPGQVSHNIYIQAGAELGYIGLTAFLLLVVSGFHSNHRTRRAANQLISAGADHARLLRNLAIGLDAGQLGFLGAGFFVTVLYYPFFWVSLALTVALRAVTVREVERWGGRSVLISRLSVPSGAERGLAGTLPRRSSQRG